MKQRENTFRKLEQSLEKSGAEIAEFQKKNKALVERIKNLEERLEQERKKYLLQIEQKQQFM